MTPEVQEIYGNRVRVRVCGLLISDDGILMINHRSLSPSDFWAPPGGGVEFGEPARTCLQREFFEETGLTVEVLDFRFACEFIKPPLHGVELFFTVTCTKGVLVTGSDPEMKSGEQLIQSAKILSWNEIADLGPLTRHGIFNIVSEPSAILQLTGYVGI